MTYRDPDTTLLESRVERLESRGAPNPEIPRMVAAVMVALIAAGAWVAHGYIEARARESANITSLCRAYPSVCERSHE